MTIWKNESEARTQIKELVADYYREFKDRRWKSHLHEEKEFLMLPVFMMKGNVQP